MRQDSRKALAHTDLWPLDSGNEPKFTEKDVPQSRRKSPKKLVMGALRRHGNPHSRPLAGC
jgi:hypothetical protein